MNFRDFYKHNFELALDFITRIDHLNPVFKVDYRFLILRIYYELSYFEQAFSALDAFKHFLTNDKEISDDFKIEFKNFARIYSEILKIKAKESKSDPLAAKKELDKLNLKTQVTWLRNKIDELIILKKQK